MRQTSQEIVVKFFVDHLISFKECKHHSSMSKHHDIEMKEFIRKHNEIIDTIRSLKNMTLYKMNDSLQMRGHGLTMR